MTATAGPASADTDELLAVRLDPARASTLGGQSITIRDADLSRAKFAQVSAGSYHTVGLTQDGVLYAWGDNTYGQLGIGKAGEATSASVPLPVKMDAMQGYPVTSIAVGGRHTIARASNGKIYTWGYNQDGQLGIGSTGHIFPEPLEVSANWLGNQSIAQIAAGEQHSVALGNNGRVYAWGYNGYGAVGNGQPSERQLTPALITVGTPGFSITEIAAGANHTLARTTSTSAVYAWGRNDGGQLGLGGDLGNRSYPVAITKGAIGTNTIIRIAGGGRHSVAIASDNKVYTWGANNNGQLGNRSFPNGSGSPVLVENTGGMGTIITQIAAGAEHTVAVGTYGRTYAWGNGNSGQLGNNSQSVAGSPVATSWSGDMVGQTVSGLSARAYDTAITLSDGRVFMWGQNEKDQLGSGVSGPGLIPRALSAHMNYRVMFGSTAGTLTTFSRSNDTITTRTPRHPGGDVEVSVIPENLYFAN